MFMKTLERIINIDRMEDAGCNEFSVAYFYTATNLTRSDKKHSVMVYGITLEKTSKNDLGQTIKERESIKDVTLCINKIKQLVRTLADHRVTPVTLKDVMEDWLAEDHCRNCFEVGHVNEGCRIA